jgi:serine/threonine-protein kinase
LGQGGFGRTYLAEDQGRFNERCAVKEFLPPQGEDHFSSKSTELFQREAAILYQIQHPQIPQFRATFEIDNRLFLVQDYVEGPSYRELLNQRRRQNATFSEGEVRQFLQQLLPVLAHIHAKGIIHRDISPDNILLRNRDRLPVLIDFGVVKEVVTRVQMPYGTQQATTVGKPGYAPPEQMQSGRAYPSSDLYSLAVTAMVLLTGREPQEISDVDLNWNWQQYVNISPGLAQVLNKAVSYRPGDRYQSVSEMAQALGAAGNYAAPTNTSPPVAVLPDHAPATPQPSQMRTVAVGRPYQSTTMAGPQARQSSSPPSPVLDDSSSSVWENPLAIGALALGLALIAGLGGWGLVNTLNRSSQSPPEADVPAIEIEPRPPVTTPQPEPEPQEPVEREPVEYSQTLALRAGESTTVEGSLRTNETVNYQFEGRQGETLLAQLEGEGVLMTVLSPNGNPPDSQARRVLGWTGPLEFTGEYTIQLSPVEGVERSNYSLQVALSDPDTEEPDTPEEPEEPEAPIPPVEPEQPEPEIISEQRVRFPDGQNTILVANSAGPSRIRRYVVNLDQGDVLTVEVSTSTGPTSFNVLSPGDDPLARSVQFWQEAVSVGGDFIVDVSATEDSEFTLQFGKQSP